MTDTAKPTRTMTLGWLAEPFDVQFPELTAEAAKDFDQINRALTLLAVKGIVSPTERDKARKRFQKILEAALAKHGGV
jgi:hypothetical protein